jgi:hypothetical protein
MFYEKPPQISGIFTPGLFFFYRQPQIQVTDVNKKQPLGIEFEKESARGKFHYRCL